MGGKAASSQPTFTPTLVLMCGLPGSGKSTFADTLAKGQTEIGRHTAPWIRVSPDEIGSLELCKPLVAKQLSRRACVVIDRCNGALKERQMFVREAKEFAPVTIEVVYFATPPDVCVERAMGRRDHPTLPPENAAEVISKFAATFRPPEDPREGPYSAIHVVTLDTPAADIRALISRLQSLGPR